MVEEGLKDLLTPHVAVSGWVLEVGMFPDEPDRATQILATGGLEANPKWLLDFPSAQISVRGEVSGYLAARDEARAIRDILLGLPAQDLNGDRWVSITMASDIAFVGRDDSHRPLFTVNFRFIIEPQATPETNRLAL